MLVTCKAPAAVYMCLACTLHARHKARKALVGCGVCLLFFLAVCASLAIWVLPIKGSVDDWQPSVCTLNGCELVGQPPRSTACGVDLVWTCSYLSRVCADKFAKISTGISNVTVTVG